MNQFNYSSGLWYKFYYVDGSTKVAKSITGLLGEPEFQTEDGIVLSNNEIMKNCIKKEPYNKQ